MNGAGGAQENGEIKVPTRQTRVWGTQIRFRISRPGHPPMSDGETQVEEARKDA
jgi:hypothetical protein